MNTDRYFANSNGGVWGQMAKPSVYAGRPSRQKIAREVDQMFARLLGGGRTQARRQDTGHADDLHTASHEAGHAYVAWRYGAQLEEIAIEAPGHGGTTRFRGLDDPDERAQALLAGALAERAILGDLSDGSDHDAEQLAEVLPLARPGVVDRTRALLDEGREAIQFLAAALVNRRRVPGDDAAAILAEHSAARPARVEERSAGPVGPQTIVIHGGQRNPRTGAWEPYRGTKTVDWPAAKAEAWNQMYAAADRNDDAGFRRWQARLSEFGR